jgi:branched-chain amino acid transport system substrate-binding protein
MKTFRMLVVYLVVAALLLSACGPASTPTAAPTNPPVPTAAPPTQAPTAVPPTEAPSAASPTEAPTEAPTAAPTSGSVSLTCDQPIKVGLITDATGALSIYGTMILRSFMLGMQYAAGAPGSAGDKFDIAQAQQNNFEFGNCEIQVFVRDDQSTPDTTASVARELIDVEGVSVLIGTVSSGATATLQGVAAENKIPLIVAPAAANDITGANFNEYTFRVSRNNYQDAINLCEYLTTKYKTFVQIAPDYSFGYGGAQAFRDACTVDGGTFVADDVFAPLDTTDFTPYMEQILNSGAEAWVVTWAGGGFIPMMQAAVDLGVMDKMALGASLADNSSVPAFYSSIVGQNSGILYHYTLPTNPINDWLVEKDKAVYGTVPDLFDADGFNAALMLVEGLKATSGDTSADALIKAWEGMSFDGPKGKISIRPEDHVAIQDMYIVKVLNVNDPEAKFFQLVQTTRPEPPCQLPEAMKDRCGSLPYGSLSGQ